MTLNKPEVNTERKNLLFVTAALHEGGVQKVTCILANTLAEHHNVTIAYCVGSDHSLLLSKKCSLRKLPAYDRGDSLPEKEAKEREQIEALRAVKKELAIDASISLGNIGNTNNAFSKGKEQVICCERNNPKKAWGKRFPLIRQAYQKADYVIFQSETVRSLFGPDIRGKSCILKNPVQIPPRAYVQRSRKIITMGRLNQQKNHALLIRSFASFHEQFPDYRLHIFGEGPLEKQTRQLIESLHLEDSVFLEGDVPDVHAQIRDAEMFVLSSDFEGLSNALLECMAMGIGCISTKCEGSTDVIRDGENGLLAEIGDEDTLTQAMCLLAENPDFRRKLEQQAMKDMKVFDKDSVTEDWERVILQCIDRQDPAEEEGL